MSDEVPSTKAARGNASSMKSALGRVRGLGSARAGTEHWWMQRLTALALIPLSLVLVGSFLNAAVFGGYTDAIAWLHSPYGAGAVVLFLAVGFHHAASGAQVVIEDYVHGETSKLASIIAVKFAAAAFAVIGILAVGRIFLGA